MARVIVTTFRLYRFADNDCELIETFGESAERAAYAAEREKNEAETDPGVSWQVWKHSR